MGCHGDVTHGIGGGHFASTGHRDVPASATSSGSTQMSRGRDWLERHGISWRIYQDTAVGLNAAGFWGWTETPTPATTATTRSCTSTSTRTPRPARRWPTRPRSAPRSTPTTVTPGRRAAGRLPRRRGARPAPAGLVDRRVRGLHRAPQLGARLRCLVRLPGRRHPRLQPGGLEQDGPLPHVRRGGRLLRPHRAADPAADAGAGPVDGADHQRDLPRRCRRPPATGAPPPTSACPGRSAACARPGRCPTPCTPPAAPATDLCPSSSATPVRLRRCSTCGRPTATRRRAATRSSRPRRRLRAPLRRPRRERPRQHHRPRHGRHHLARQPSGESATNRHRAVQGGPSSVRRWRPFSEGGCPR